MRAPILLFSFHHCSFILHWCRIFTSWLLPRALGPLTNMLQVEIAQSYYYYSRIYCGWLLCSSHLILSISITHEACYEFFCFYMSTLSCCILFLGCCSKVGRVSPTVCCKSFFFLFLLFRNTIHYDLFSYNDLWI